MVMLKDYVKQHKKYSYKTSRRGNRHYLWIILAVVGLFILGLFFLKSINRHKPIQKTEIKLKKKMEDHLKPKAPEPNFDFYNVLPQNKLSLSPQEKPPAKPIEPTNTISAVQESLAVMSNMTPEQLAIRAKKQLEQEVEQLTKVTYLLVLGNFVDADQAEQLQAQILLKGFPAQKKLNLVNEKLVYQVFIGPYSSIDKPTQDQRRLNLAGLDAVLTKIRS